MCVCVYPFDLIEFQLASPPTLSLEASDSFSFFQLQLQLKQKLTIKKKKKPSNPHHAALCLRHLTYIAESHWMKTSRDTDSSIIPFFIL